MPLPRWLARFNRRATNHLLRPLVTRLPGWGEVVHTGRRTGREYRTPVIFFRRADRFVVALDYGPDADWVRNVLASGGCRLETQGRVLRMVRPRVVRDEPRLAAPLPVRLMLRLTRAVDFLELEQEEGGTEGTGSRDDEPGAVMRTPVAAAISAAFFLVGPGVFVGLVPWLMTGWQMRTPARWWAPLRGLGALLIATGVGVLVQAFARFVAEGRGFWERRAREPMLPPQLFRTRAFSAGNATGCLLYASLYGALFFVAQFLQTVQGYGPLGAGLRLLPWTACLFLVSPVAGALVNRLGERSLAVGGLLLQALGMAWIARIASPDLPYAALVPPLVVAGAGVSMAMPVAQNAVVGSVVKTDLGKASGTFNMLRFLGGVFGTAILVAAFATAGGFGSARAFTDGFAAAFGGAAALSLAGALAGLGLPGRRPAAAAPLTANA